jgi:hypothetical protein
MTIRRTLEGRLIPFERRMDAFEKANRSARRERGNRGIALEENSFPPCSSSCRGITYTGLRAQSGGDAISALFRADPDGWSRPLRVARLEGTLRPSKGWEVPAAPAQDADRIRYDRPWWDCHAEALDRL